jgi:hypothetical protein
VTGHEHSDDLADAVALAQAVREDRTGDVAVLLRHCSPFGVIVTLAKLLAAAADESNASAEHMRFWAERAVRRP